MVFVIEESKYYIANNKQEWVEKKSNSSEELDAEININENGIYDVSFAASANINVPVGVFPEGEEIITENGDYDIAEKATARVNVPQGVFPTGTKQVTITQNGTTTENVMNYADVEITVNTDPAKGLVFEDYDSDGYPHVQRFIGVVGNGAWNYPKKFDSLIETIIIPDGVTSFANEIIGFRANLKNIIFPHNAVTFGDKSFYNNQKLQKIQLFGDVTFNATGAFQGCTVVSSVIIGGSISIAKGIANNTFYNCNAVALYDFSHCTAIPLLYSTASLGHASDCVIRIPAALSDTTLGEGNGWESATNWSALTDIVWEVV